MFNENALNYQSPTDYAHNLSRHGGHDMGHIIAGHKANLHNPNTSEESKEHSRQFLENIDRESGLHHVSGLQNPRDRSASSSISSASGASYGHNSHSYYPSHSSAGLVNDLDAVPVAPNHPTVAVPGQAVMVDFDRPVVVEEKNLGNVIGGYKATLHNPRVSEEAKERAAHALEELGVEPDYHPKSRDEDM